MADETRFESITIKLELRRARRVTMDVPIRSVTSLIQKRFSKTTQREIEKAQQGKATRKKPRDPEAEYRRAFYHDKEGRLCHPSSGFKGAMVDGCREVDTVSMVSARTLFYIAPDWILLEDHSEPYMRTDPVKLQPGTSSLAYRPCFEEWKATLPITFFIDRIPAETIINIVEEAGLMGVGEWRPSAPKNKAGKHGQFEVDIERFDEMNDGRDLPE